MIITQDKPKFRPVNMRLESSDEYQILLAICDAVACNRVTHTPQLIRAAVEYRDRLAALEDDS